MSNRWSTCSGRSRSPAFAVAATAGSSTSSWSTSSAMTAGTCPPARSCLGMWPTGSTEEGVVEETLGNYLSELRAESGSTTCPRPAVRATCSLASPRTGRTSSTWCARPTPPEETERASCGAEALALVRGRPFEDVIELYEWVGGEHLDTQMTVAVATCALSLATDRLKAGDYRGAFDAAVAGLRGAGPDVLRALGGGRPGARRGGRTNRAHALDRRCRPPPQPGRDRPNRGVARARLRPRLLVGKGKVVHGGLSSPAL